ncbi:MAG: TIGR02391 family protein, partial [Solirubrobacterales bacterium]
MVSSLEFFEKIARRAYRFTEAATTPLRTEHPFEARDVHPDLPTVVRSLFDNGHYAQATLEAFKFLDEEIQRISGSSEYGTSLMMRAFGGTSPMLKLNTGLSMSDKNEQEGFKFLFAGAMQGIRNPRGHASGIVDDPDICLDHL